MFRIPKASVTYHAKKDTPEKEFPKEDRKTAEQIEKEEQEWEIRRKKREQAAQEEEQARVEREIQSQKQIESTLQEAQSQAQSILEKAKDEAQKQAKIILHEARAQVEESKKEGWQEGFASGKQEAWEQGQAQRREDARELQDFILKLNADNEAQLMGLQDEVLSLALDIAKKVITIELDRNDEAFITLVRSALAQMRATGRVTLTVNKQDLSRHFTREMTFQDAQGKTVEVLPMANPNMQPYDCLLESEGETVNASVSLQIENIASALGAQEMANE